jgi:26S proteasome regulatory subunit N5
LIKRLAKIKEEQGKIDEAADLMQEIAVSLHCTKIEDMYYCLLWQCFVTL